MLRNLLAPLLLLSATAAAQPAVPAVTARLACNKQELIAGRTNTVAVVLDVPDGWHVYARCLNDSGLPVTVALTAPTGWAQRPAEWPTPERLVSPGDLLDHVYTGRVVLPVLLIIPATAAGTRGALSAHVAWMACRTSCVLGSADVSLELPVVPAGSVTDDSADGLLFREQAARTARPLPEAEPPLTAAIESGALVLRAPDATRISFYPDADCAPVEGLLHAGTTDGTTLTLRVHDPSTGVVRGVVELHRADRPTDFFRIELPLPAPSPAPGAANGPP